jgi:hypothetical protein
VFTSRPASLLISNKADVLLCFAVFIPHPHTILTSSA